MQIKIKVRHSVRVIQEISYMIAVLFCLSTTFAQANPVVCFKSNAGDFCIELFEELAPGTVENFLNYVNEGAYDGSIIHRSVPGFIVQGGGFTIDENLQIMDVMLDDAIVNEFSRSNTRGTVAMAKLGDDPDSAQSQWFVNLVDNSESLDSIYGGFTVFGQISEEDMLVFDDIAELQLLNLGGAFKSIPVIGYENGPLQFENYVVISEAKLQLPDENPPIDPVDPVEPVDFVPPSAPVYVASYQDRRLSFPVDAGIFGYLEVTLDLVSGAPNITFRLDESSLLSLSELPAEHAVYAHELKTLSIPSVDISDSSVARNVVMQLSDVQTYTFTLLSMQEEQQ